MRLTGRFFLLLLFLCINSTSYSLIELYHALEEPPEVIKFLALSFSFSTSGVVCTRLTAHNGQALVHPGTKMKGEEAPSADSNRKLALREENHCRCATQLLTVRRHASTFNPRLCLFCGFDPRALVTLSLIHISEPTRQS